MTLLPMHSFLGQAERRLTMAAATAGLVLDDIVEHGLTSATHADELRRLSDEFADLAGVFMRDMPTLAHEFGTTAGKLSSATFEHVAASEAAYTTAVATSKRLVSAIRSGAIDENDLAFKLASAVQHRDAVVPPVMPTSIEEMLQGAAKTANEGAAVLRAVRAGDTTSAALHEVPDRFLRDTIAATERISAEAAAERAPAVTAAQAEIDRVTAQIRQQGAWRDGGLGTQLADALAAREQALANTRHASII